MKQRADQNDFDQFSIRCQSLDRAFRDIYKRQKAEASFLINRFTSPDWNLAVFGTGAINGWDKVKITHWDNSITAL